MDNDDFYGGLKTDRENDREHVDAAEHFVRLKKQVEPSTCPGDNAGEPIEKVAGLPEPVKGDISPRAYQHEGENRVGMDGRKGYNFTAVPHEGKHHILVDHHSSGRVGHYIMDPASGQMEHSELHPSHKHMAAKFQEHVGLLNQHLSQQAMGGQEKMANLLGGASSQSLLGGIKPISPVGATSAKPPSAPGNPAGGGSSIGGGGMPKMGGETVESIELGGKPGIGTVASHLVKKLKDRHEKTASLLQDAKNPAFGIPAAVGAGVLGGMTYMASRPQKDLRGRSRAEAEGEEIVQGQKAQGEQGAGLAKKLKNRLSELNLGFAKAFREHPVKGALLGAGTGASLGFSAARALGGKR
jgi:hypothetical protein